MQITEQILDVFLDESPEFVFDLIKSNSQFVFLQDFNNVLNVLSQLNREGYYGEIINFLDYVNVQENIFNSSEEKVKELILTCYIRAYYYQGKLEEIEKISQKFLNEFPNSTIIKFTAWGGLAVAAKNKGNYEKAFIQHCEIIKTVKADKDSKQWYDILYLSVANIAIIYHQLDKYSQAIKLYEIALKINEKLEPKNDSTNLKLNIAHCVANDQNKIDIAISIVDECIENYKSKKIKIDLMAYKLCRLYKAKFLLKANKIQKAKDIIDDFIPVKKNNEQLVKNEAIYCYLTYLFSNREYNAFIRIFLKNYKYLLEDDNTKILEDILIKAREIIDFTEDKNFENQVNEIEEDFQKKYGENKIIINESILNQEILIDI